MASFCGSCGFPLGASVAFCSRCGARQASAPTAPAAPPAAASNPVAPAPAKGSSGLKILLVVLGCFVVAGVLAIGAVLYIGHRVKQAVVEKAATYGVDLKSVGSASTSSGSGRTTFSCDQLSKDTVASLIGEPIERMVKDGSSCTYYGPPGLSMRLAKANTESTFQEIQKPGSKAGGAAVADAVTNMLGSVAAAAGKNGSQGEAPLLILIIEGDGQSQFTAMNATKSIFGGIPGVGADIPGLGDHAIRLANLGLNVLKGDTIIRIVPGPLPDANNRTVALARDILSKL